MNSGTLTLKRLKSGPGKELRFRLGPGTLTWKKGNQWRELSRAGSSSPMLDFCAGEVPLLRLYSSFHTDLNERGDSETEQVSEFLKACDQVYPEDRSVSEIELKVGSFELSCFLQYYRLEVQAFHSDSSIRSAELTLDLLGLSPWPSAITQPRIEPQSDAIISVDSPIDWLIAGALGAKAIYRIAKTLKKVSDLKPQAPVKPMEKLAPPPKPPSAPEKFIPRDQQGKLIPLPRDQHGVAVPSSKHPHTQLGGRQGRQGEYRQTREWDAHGKEIKSTDWTDHGRNHPNPHDHFVEPNPSGGSPQRGSARASEPHPPKKPSTNQ